jgi:MFS family permease
MIFQVLKKMKIIFEVNFILVLAMATTAYIHSSYLSNLNLNIPTGLLFAFGSAAALGSTFHSPYLFQKFGVKKSIVLAGILNILGLLMMGISTNETLSILAFIITLASTALVVIGIDVVINHFTIKKEAGEVRGLNLALGNLAFLIGPLLAGIIANKTNINTVYIFAALLIMGMVVFFEQKFKKFELQPKHTKQIGINDFLLLWKKEKIKHAYISGFMIEYFFAIWAIFTSIYMHEVIGFNWAQIGLILALMHVPYIILEPIIGDIADRYNNEKKLMKIGLFITGLSFLWIALIRHDIVIIWIIASVFTRIGASFGQVAHESFFFKQIQPSESGLVSMYRTMSPLALLVAPISGSIILLFTGYSNLFIFVSILLLASITLANKLKHPNTYEQTRKTTD